MGTEDNYLNHTANCPGCRRGLDCPIGNRLYNAWKHAKDMYPLVKMSEQHTDPLRIEVLWDAEDQPTAVVWNGRTFKLVEEEL